MVNAWYMDDSAEDQRLEHKTEPVEPVSVEELAKLGVLYWRVEPGPESEQFSTPALEKIRKDRGYVNADVINVSKDTLPNYEERIKGFFEEHLHVDEEIRYCVDGSGYFDVRGPGERWIRIKVRPADLIVLPAGIYHRFTLDTNNYIKAVRLFLEEPVWTPYNRSDPATDELGARKTYAASSTA